MGTDYTYEDFEDENIDRYEYTLLGEEMVGDLLCYKIDAIPVAEKKKYSGYSRRFLWIEKEHYYIAKIDFFDHRDQLLKTLSLNGYSPMKEELWRARNLMMENVNGHKTVVRIVYNDIDSIIVDKTFDFRFIETKGYLQR